MVDVPPELQAAFEDALNRQCFACGHQVRTHLSTSDCHCCQKGVKMPTEQLREMAEIVRQAAEAVRELNGQ